MTGSAGSGYTYQLWQSGSGGCMTYFGVGAAFKANWGPNSQDFLARNGLASPTGTLTATFAETKSGGAGGYSYIGIYGWSTNPLTEYYIVDDWYGNGPPNPGGTMVGTFTVDGGSYAIYHHQQINQPNITGKNQNFWQNFSVRQTPRTCGTISISQHFSEWSGKGMALGTLEEASILIEAGGGTGNITFSTATVTAK
jgi:hypothetical protein